jgi:chitin deacetylase
MIDFASKYPPGWSTPPANMLPKAWTDKLASIQMPDVPVSNPNGGYPTYSNGKTGSDPSICSFTYECTTDDDLHIPPDGVWAVRYYFTLMSKGTKLTISLLSTMVSEQLPQSYTIS